MDWAILRKGHRVSLPMSNQSASGCDREALCSAKKQLHDDCEFIIILRLPNQLYQLIIERRHDSCVCAASRAFLLVEPHHYALVIDIGECQF